jgi:diacylglycerol kinase family enzyme
VVPRSIYLIANPAAGDGRAARLLPTVRRAFDGVGARETIVTTGPGDEARCVRRALDAGADTIAILGGDGTWSKATGAIIDAGAGASCRAVLLAGGTGNDFVAALGGQSRAWVTLARLAAEGPARAVDTLRVDGRHALNAAGFGFDVGVLETLQRVGGVAGIVRGALRYRLVALQQIFRYRAVEFDPGDGHGLRPLLLAVIANGFRYGGGLPIAPGARPDDGMIDLVTVDDVGPLRRLVLFQAVTAGRHLSLDVVRSVRRPAFTLCFAAPPRFQLDGELHDARGPELRVECVPAALLLVTTAAASAAAPAQRHPEESPGSPTLASLRSSPGPASRSSGGR